MSQEIISFNWTFDERSVRDLYVGNDLAFFRLKKLMPEFVWDIIHLEDNPYTFTEVQTLIHGTTVGGYSLSDQNQVLNQFESLKYLLKLVKNNKFICNQETILAAHNILAKGEALKWGCLRDGEVSISGTGHKPPLAGELNQLHLAGLKEISNVENVFERALLYFCFGSINQFFFDGNKRTSRWAMNGILMSNGYNYLSIPGDKKTEFNNAMVNFYDTKDATEIMKFMISCYVLD
ncbi:Huntingtin interacting protein E-like protein [hydrothermal vent metagenome]|uniref:Huntingtin interacting protein E-like protein n=1 Tax=hydrothermal vent metagenome TaxID=652676 RepID=A0A3B0XFD5_9ZZZZ